MKLIDEIKKIEEKAAELKKNTEIEGQKLLEKESESGEKEFMALDDEKEKLLESNLADARKSADAEVKSLQKEHGKGLKKIEESYKKNKDKAIKKVREIVFKWPSSR